MWTHGLFAKLDILWTHFLKLVWYYLLALVLQNGWMVHFGWRLSYLPRWIGINSHLVHFFSLFFVVHPCSSNPKSTSVWNILDFGFLSLIHIKQAKILLFWQERGFQRNFCILCPAMLLFILLVLNLANTSSLIVSKSSCWILFP